jgi:hypothetical protein
LPFFQVMKAGTKPKDIQAIAKQFGLV